MYSVLINRLYCFFFSHFDRYNKKCTSFFNQTIISGHQLIKAINHWQNSGYQQPDSAYQCNNSASHWRKPAYQYGNAGHQCGNSGQHYAKTAYQCIMTGQQYRSAAYHRILTASHCNCLAYHLRDKISINNIQRILKDTIRNLIQLPCSFSEQIKFQLITL